MNYPILRKIVIIFTIGIGLFALLYLSLFAWVCYAESHLETPPATDAMIVLGAQVKEDGTPSVQLQYRLETALSAYQQQPQTIVCCGGQAGSEPAPEGQVMAEWLIARGIPSTDVIAETASGDTVQNLRNAITLLGYTPQNVLIVTSDYHVARALQIAKDLGLNAWGMSAPTLPEYWLKNRAREALGWGKYILRRFIGK